MKRTGRVRRDWRKLRRTLLLYLASLIFVVPSLVPFVWILSTSLKTFGEIYVSPPLWWPRNPTLQAYTSILFKTDMSQSALNSLAIASVTTLLALLFGVSAGYGFARFRFLGHNALAISVLFSQMLPQSVVLIPLYLSFDRLGLIDTYPALWISYLVTVLPLCTWMLRSYFLELPQEIEEAALIDGCSRIGILLRIVIPLATPAIVATGLFAFTVAWNEFLFAVTFTQTMRTRTLPVRLAAFTGETDTDWAAIMAAAIIMSVPVVVIFLTFQRYFVRGLAGGAVKG